MKNGEQQHEKFSFLGFAQNKFMGGEYSFCLSVSSELSRCKPEIPQRLPDDGGASPVLQWTLKHNELRNTQDLRGVYIFMSNTALRGGTLQ